MKQVAIHTRPNPIQRVSQLHSFSQRLQNSEESYRVLRDWQFNLGNELVTFPGRKLNPEVIRFGHEGTNERDRDFDKADWMTCFANHSFYEDGALTNWIILHSDRNKNTAIDLLSRMQASVRKMRYQIDEPQL